MADIALPADSAGTAVPVQTITGRIIDTRPVCYCGNVTPRGHGEIGDRRPFTCDEVLAIRARVERPPRRRWFR